MKDQTENIVKKIISWSLVALSALTPLFFLPSTVNFFDPAKIGLTILIALVVVFSWLVLVFTQRHIRLTTSPFTLPLTLMAIIYLVSSVIGQPNPVEALMGKGVLIPLLVLIFVIATSVLQGKETVRFALYGLMVSAVVLSLLSILQAINGGVSLAVNNLFGTQLPATLAFSPAGSPLSMITFILPVFIGTLLMAFSRKEGLKTMALFVTAGVMFGALILGLVFAFPGSDNAPVLMPYKTGYSIMLATFQRPALIALFGYGPEGYVNSFTRNRPGASNLTEQWNLRFASGSNEPFTLAGSVGALGLVVWLWLLFEVGKQFAVRSYTTEHKVLKLLVMVVFIIQLLIPANTVLLIMTFMLLTLLALELKANNSRAVRDLSLAFRDLKKLRPEEEYVPGKDVAGSSSGVAYLVAIPMALLMLTLAYYTTRVYAAEVAFADSLRAASNNDGNKTYELQQAAIRRNPRVSAYHRTYALTNLNLANAIAAQGELSDQDRANIAQLIQQSIREAKNAVSLDQMNAANWETLATIYRNLINVAQNSEQWTIASYLQAIQTDPINPRLRLELGGVYFGLEQYDQAIRLFQQSTELKPDWANAYFNLAMAHKAKNELQLALVNMQQVVQLLDPESPDMAKAQEELNALREALNIAVEPTNAQQSGDLTTPAPLPSPIPEGPIELPEGTGPENAGEEPVTGEEEQVEPTNIPEATPSPSPTS